MPIVRNPARWPGPEPARIADLQNPDAMRTALAGAVWIVSCAHARYAPAIIDAAPPEARFVFLGSTRKFTSWPDAHATGVIAGETAFLASGRSGVMLHPTMIYGAEGENNVQRLAALLRRLPVIPLPRAGRSLVQPIYQDDVTRCIRAALARDWTGPHTLIIAGPAPLPYAGFVRAVAEANGLRSRPVFNLPLPPLITIARLASMIPGFPHVHPDELRRLTEDKAFDIAPMRQELGVEPVPLANGLAFTFGRRFSAQPLIPQSTG